jgi:aminoglycoside phosphotransferase (APT) family kinase protein
VAIFQDAVEGEWRDDVDDDLASTIFALNDLQAGEADQPTGWRDYIAQTLIEGADGYCIHDTLGNYSAETLDVLRWVEDVGNSVRRLPCTDIVHLDFHHRNMLRVDERLSAVVDWEGCTSGDRVFDLITFSFGFTHADGDPEVEERVWARATVLGLPDQLMAYTAHMALRRLDWTIRHHSAGDVARLIGFIARYRSRLA